MTVEEGGAAIGDFIGSAWEAFLSVSLSHIGMAVSGVFVFLVAYVISQAGDELENRLMNVLVQVAAVTIAVLGAGAVVTGIVGVFRSDIFPL